MEIITLIPFVLCVLLFFRDSVQKAFLNVYLPIFMVFPIYYYWKVAALPPVDPSEAVLFPLGLAILVKEMPRWRFTTMDLWMAIFLVSTFFTELEKGREVSAIFQLFSNGCIALVPYMAGKVLIEQPGARVATLKRICFLLFIASIIAMYEYRMGVNPFTLALSRFFPDEHFAWKTQIRWGMGRVSGPYGQSELAGMMLFFGLVLTLYLAYYHLWEPKFSSAKWIPYSKSTVIAWTIGITLFMTQARGPWLGSIVAVPIAMIGRTKNILRSSILLGTLALIGGPITYVAFKAYADAPVSSSEQENAQYRSHLLDNYLPIAAGGGPFGYGSKFPQVPGQGSIDNEYLFVYLTQGWVGLAAFCMLGAEMVVRLIAAAFLNRQKKDRYFAFSLLGVVIGMLLTIATVFLGNQPYELFFLLAGWSQAVYLKPAAQRQLAFQQVYT